MKKHRFHVVLATTALITASVAAPPAQAATPTCGGKAATIVGTPGDDELVGTDGDDVIVALEGDDRLYGGLGADLLCGGPGSDAMRGNPGNDTLDGGFDGPDGYGSDELEGGAGDDTLIGGGDAEGDVITFHRSPAAVTVDLRAGTATGDGADTISLQPWTVTGSPYDDVIVGSDHDDSLAGMEGNDVVRGMEGDDVLWDGADAEKCCYFDEETAASDVLEGGSGNDHLIASAGIDRLVGGPGRDSLEDFDDGADVLLGGGQRDCIGFALTMAPGQEVDGGPGRDCVGTWAPRRARVALDMASGELRITRDDVRVKAILARAEVLSVGGGSWNVTGTAGPDRIEGWSARRLVVHARGGDDTVVGSYRTDRFDGGVGFDTVWPNGGMDTCVRVEKVRPAGTCRRP